jgi:hypothetical protein
MQVRPVPLGAAGFLGKDAVAASRVQGLQLQREILVLGRDAGRTDVHGHRVTPSDGQVISQNAPQR